MAKRYGLVAAMLVGLLAMAWIAQAGAEPSTMPVSRPSTSTAPSRDAMLRTISKCAVSWWPADGHTDDVISGNSLTGPPEPDYGEGRVGKCFRFKSNHLCARDTVPLRLKGAFTLSVWCKANKPPNIYGVPLSTIDDLGAGYRFLLGRDTGRVTFYVGKPATPASCVDIEGPDVCDGKWHHIVGTLSEGEIRLYVDGNLCASKGQATANYTDTRFTVGLDAHLWGGQDRHYVGDLDEVMVFNQSLDEHHVQGLYELWQEKLDPLAEAEIAPLVAAIKDPKSPLALYAMVRLSQGGPAAEKAVRAMTGKVQPPDVTALIRQLDDDSWKVREEATRKLIAMGPSIEQSLRAALKTAAMEAKTRLQNVLEKIGPGETDPVQQRIESVLNRLAGKQP